MKSTAGKHHSQELKESIARRYIQTDVTYRELGDEIGAQKSTICGWVREFRERGSVGRRSKKAKTTEGRSAEEKLRLVLQAAAVPEEDRGAFLRREGIHDDDLARWKQEALGGLDSGSRTKDRRIRDLERRSEKQARRLREAEALLELQKKVHALWGDEDDDTPVSDDKS